MKFEVIKVIFIIILLLYHIIMIIDFVWNTHFDEDKTSRHHERHLKDLVDAEDRFIFRCTVW